MPRKKKIPIEKAGLEFGVDTPRPDEINISQRRKQREINKQRLLSEQPHLRTTLVKFNIRAELWHEVSDECKKIKSMVDGKLCGLSTHGLLRDLLIAWLAAQTDRPLHELVARENDALLGMKEELQKARKINEEITEANRRAPTRKGQTAPPIEVPGMPQPTLNLLAKNPFAKKKKQ